LAKGPLEKRSAFEERSKEYNTYKEISEKPYNEPKYPDGYVQPEIRSAIGEFNLNKDNYLPKPDYKGDDKYNEYKAETIRYEEPKQEYKPEVYKYQEPPSKYEKEPEAKHEPKYERA
jgi:hypothetical protein